MENDKWKIMENDKWKIFFSLSTYLTNIVIRKRTGRNACPTSCSASMSAVLPKVAKVTTPIATIHS